MPSLLQTNLMNKPLDTRWRPKRQDRIDKVLVIAAIELVNGILIDRDGSIVRRCSR